MEIGSLLNEDQYIHPPISIRPQEVIASVLHCFSRVIKRIRMLEFGAYEKGNYTQLLPVV